MTFPASTARTAFAIALLAAAALPLLSALPVRGGEFPVFADAGDFLALSYHDVVETREELMPDSVTLDHLIYHFEWLLAEGYHPVSVAEILDARAGGKPLPPKAVLLSFDDGYRSFHDKVFPLLQAYRFPSVVCLVTRWMETPEGGTLSYGKDELPRSEFLTWEQVRDMDRSGLVEIASHSHDLHREIIATAEGNGLAAGAFLARDRSSGRYESRAAHRERVRADIRRSQEIFRKRLGHPARVLVWPYGRYNADGVRSAETEGFEICLTLNKEPGRLGNLMETGRLYLAGNPTPAGFRQILENPREQVTGRFPLLEIDSVLGPSRADTSKNPPPPAGGAPANRRVREETSAGTLPGEDRLSRWLDRCSSLAPDGVALRPWHFDGEQVRAAFPSEHLPLSRDKLLRTIWQTWTRGGTATWLWLVNDRPSWNWSDREMIRAWPESAPFAPVRGVTIGGPEISPALLDLVRDLPSVPEGGDLAETTGTRRRNRQVLLRSTARHATLAGQTLAKLEAFQEWQPYAQVFFLLPWETARALGEEDHRSFARFFDRVVVDARGAGRTELLSEFRQRPRDSWLAARAQLLVDFSPGPLQPGKAASRRLAGLLAELERAGLRSWIYDRDRPQAELPALHEARTVMSSRSFPWNHHEFRLYDEKYWPIRHGEGRPSRGSGESASGGAAPAIPEANYR